MSTTAVAAQQEIMLRHDISDQKILLQLLKVKKHQMALDIFELIETFNEFKRAGPGDKLYALQDIGHLRQQLFTIDYGKDKHQVFLDFLIPCLKLAKSGHALSNRQFDILSRLAGVMGLQVEFQKVPPGDDSEFISHRTQEDGSRDSSTSLRVHAEDIEMFKESIDYVADKDVRIFGPQDNEETGHRISPLSKKYSQGRIPNIFKVPTSIDLEEMIRVAYQDLANQLCLD